MFKTKTFVLAALLAFANLANAAGLGCEAGLYSRYVNGVGGVTEKNPVVQGSCRWTTEKGWYVDGWLSEPLNQTPGNKFGREFDLTLGRDWKLNEKWSMDLFGAYYDISNPDVFKGGMNGDFLSAGGTLRYHMTEKTMLFVKYDGFYGVGDRGFPGGWRTGFGASTTFGPVSVTGTLFHNENFFGHGQFLKVMLEPKAPMVKFAGGEVRPAIFVYQPLGGYRRDFDTRVVGAIKFTF